MESENAHNAYGALVDGEAVCEGYAEALQYLLHRVGIRSFIAIGSSVNPGSQQSEGHAWNYVRINGQYYHVDLTWNDQDQNIYHAYFNVDDATIMQDHAVEDTPLALPTCNSTAANYFKVKGGWLDSYTVESVAKLLRKNNLSVSVYIPGDIDTFTDWYYDNIRDIAKAIPIEGGYSYGYSRMGHEMILRMSGTIGEIPEEPDDPVEPDVPVGPDDPVDPEPVKDGWVKEGSRWAYYEQGARVVNRWVKDSVGWCYLGEDGYAVSDCWKQDSVGWCYLNSNGSMTKNAWVKTDGQWYYLDGNGYRVTNAWKKDSKGWVYVGADGAMKTNAWVRDSIGWCYVGADGYAVTNCWKKDSVGWCYLNSNGSMTKNAWVKDGNKWYYLDGDGYMVTNAWKKDSKGWVYVGADGAMKTNAWVRDSIGWC